VLHPTNRIRMANNDLRSAGAVWGGFLARYLLNLDIATQTKLTRTISATDNNRFMYSSFWKWYCFQCVYVLCPLKHLLLTKTSSTTFTLHILLFSFIHPPPFWDHWDL
jgi:hypothetical protein